MKDTGMRRSSPLGPLAELRWSVVQKVLAEINPHKVLEIGCGLGGFGARIAATADYVGIEPDPVAFSTAQRRVRAAGGRVVQGQITDVIDPLGFDLVCAFEVIEHIEDDRQALGEWVHMVAPGGTILLSAPAGPERFGAWDELVGHHRRYRPTDLEAALASAGCTEIRHFMYGWPLGLVTERARNRIARRRLDAMLETTITARTAASGRTLQPGELTGLAVRLGVVPFAALQRYRPASGIGVVCAGRVAS